MKKIILVGLSISIILLGGCGVETNEVKKAHAEQEQKRPKDMDPQDLPQATAFQDEKTREFMVSTQEVEPGYYLLEGKSKAFRMLFPENGEYMERISSYDGGNGETIGFDSYDEAGNITYDIRVKYYNERSFLGDLEGMLEIVSGKNGYQGDYQKEEIHNLEIYKAFQKNVYDDLELKYNYDYTYFGFIRPINSENEGIDFSLGFSCKDENRSCLLEETYTNEKVNKIIQSIQFIGTENE
jgi:hypothetical protein